MSDKFSALLSVAWRRSWSSTWKAGSSSSATTRTVADFVAAYTLNMATVQTQHKLLDNLPRLREYMDRMYKRPNAPPRITEAFASLRSDIG